MLPLKTTETTETTMMKDFKEFTTEEIRIAACLAAGRAGLIGRGVTYSSLLGSREELLKIFVRARKVLDKKWGVRDRKWRAKKRPWPPTTRRELMSR